MPHADKVDKNMKTIYNQNDVERIVSIAVGQAISEYAAQRANLENSISASLLYDQEEEDKLMGSKYKERIKVGTDQNGSPQYRWACANTKEELHLEIARIMNSRDQAISPKRRSVIWQDIADEWFNLFHASKVRQNTLAKDKSLFQKHVRTAFEDNTIDKISASEIQEYLESKAMYCKSQVRDIMWMLKKVFALAVDKDLIPKNPMCSALVYNPSKKPDRPREALSKADQSDIISNLDKLRDVHDRNGDSMNALRFMAFLMFTGLRPCEIYGLRWEDMDFDRMTLSIKRDLVFLGGKGIIGEPKTPESKREIPFDPALMAYLKPVQDTGFIIHMTGKGREEEHFTEQAAFNMWKRIKKAIDVHGMTPYMARHTYATNMNKAGVPIKTAMSMMGHKDERMLLRRYTHTDVEDLTKATASVSEYLSQI